MTEIEEIQKEIAQKEETFELLNASAIALQSGRQADAKRETAQNLKKEIADLYRKMNSLE